MRGGVCPGPTPVESTQAASVEPIADADAGSGSTQNDGAAGTSVSSSSGNATLTLSRNAVGNVDSTAPLQLVFDVRTNPGDVYTITVPESITNGTGVYTIGDSDPISAATGTVISTTYNTNHTKTFTYRFDSVASVAANINFTLHNNYNAQPTPIKGIGTSIKSITWTYAGQQLDPVDFTQVIMPVMNPQAVTRVLPSSSTYKAIYANQDYAYQFSVGGRRRHRRQCGLRDRPSQFGGELRHHDPCAGATVLHARRKRHCRPQRLQRRDDDHAARRRFIRHRHHCAQRLRSPVLAERGAVLFRGPIQGHPATRG